MKKEPRRWFDLAYSFTSGFLPFSILTTKAWTKEDLERIVPFADEEFLEAVLQKAPKFYEKLPCADDFIEEKNRIFKKLIPKLKKKLSFVETAVLFGSLRDDIDMGLISQRQMPEKAISDSDKITEKYPIVDWSALEYFKSKSGYELAEKISETRLELNKTEIAYIKGTIYNARILWGSEKELDSMKKFFERNF